jgi:hypothetical protein
VGLYRGLAAARPDAFTPDLATSLNNPANRLSDLGRREDALAAAEEAVRLRRALAAARPDAFGLELARSLWVLGDLKAEADDRDGGADLLAEGVRWLTPVFTAYPAAVRDLMAGLRQSYLACCEAGNRDPDTALLAPVLAVFQRLEPSAAPATRAMGETRPAPPGFWRRILGSLQSMAKRTYKRP